MIAFIYVATLVPSLFIGLQSRTIDYDAVAYRTGVILVEDPGNRTIPHGKLKPMPRNMMCCGSGLRCQKIPQTSFRKQK